MKWSTRPNWRIGICGITLLTLAACQAPSSTNRGDVRPDGGSASTAPARFVLCREGLPQDGNWKCDPALVDVNHDGLMDLAAHIRLKPGPEVWLGDGQGRWSLSDRGLNADDSSCGGGLVFGDLNHDGHPDLVTADHCDGLYVYLGDGAGNWTMTMEERYPRFKVPDRKIEIERYNGAETVALGDINNDGHVDIVSGASDAGGITIYLGDGSGREFKELEDTGIWAPRWVMRVRLADLNGDGNLDVAGTCTEGPRVWLGNGQGKFRPSSAGLPTPMYGGIFHGMAIGDVNEDGRPDLVVANYYDGPIVYVQDEDGRWTWTPDVFPVMKGGASNVALGDIDQDGHLDIVVTGRLPYEVGYVYGVFWLRGDGKGNWEYVEDCGLPDSGLPYTYGVTLDDVNRDGVLDIAVASGGAVANNPKYADPEIPAGLLVWCTQLNSD